ncbi:hypothetical protein DSM03_102470 [Leeuwenhoekiella aestuarii]|uniref:Uncharacterized protein n=1 Tax=Leeuwenhoekiella aestuarii TaxID=2249426 RepID=A0A4Q0NWY7_9FLAO|nr:DUF6428 family protein [Leeuwenhoekiella aestuarii]RXG15300.1 hypothetical protein DSM04_103188 [Leeuwenhoekiella aestuarii]RXG17593.1 hypothetical protein DSM03_102470 [Leeuwenhoekiella aestuarii]
MSITFSEFKKLLSKSYKIGFELPNGKLVPNHFTITEIGEQITNSIDLNGKFQKQSYLVLQLKPFGTFNHRLHPEKLLELLKLAEQSFDVEKLTVLIAYEAESTTLYKLEGSETYFKLLPVLDESKTNEKQKVNRKQTTPLMDAASDPCIPGNGCC